MVCLRSRGTHAHEMFLDSYLPSFCQLYQLLCLSCTCLRAKLGPQPLTLRLLVPRKYPHFAINPAYASTLPNHYCGKGEPRHRSPPDMYVHPIQQV